MGFIEFPFIEVPEDLRKIVGEPTPGTRAYRREGTHAECGQWIEDLGLHYKGDVGISPAGVTMFVPVQRAAVHKRIKEGKLTAFFFYITHVESTFFGTKRKVKMRPYIVLSVSECKAWVAEMKRRMGYVDEPGETPMKQSERLLKRGAAARSQKPQRKPRKSWTLRKPTRRTRATGRSSMRRGLIRRTGNRICFCCWRKRWPRWRPSKEG